MHALVIEDDPLVAMCVEDALRDSGCTSFSFAASLEEAIAAARQRCPDVITADVQLAPGCGIDAVEAICADGQIPVVFVTGTPRLVQERLPSHPIVHKPFDSSELIAAVRRVTSAIEAKPRRG